MLNQRKNNLGEAEMNIEVKQFLENSREPLKNEDWRALYDKAANLLIPQSVGQLTQVLESVNLNPLDDLDFVPICYHTGDTSLESVSIPEGIKIIQNNAFAGCTNLTQVTIPLSVEAIRYAAFFNCSKLKVINYAGTRNQWFSIKKEQDAFLSTPPDTVIHCIDADLV